MIRISEVSLAEFRDSDCLSVDFPLISRVVTLLQCGREVIVLPDAPLPGSRCHVDRW
jgi:hypothetical protein